nr:tetratricopeptide repeat protein [Micromonospora chokoriensis]
MWQRRELDLLVWVTATSRSNTITGYSQAAADVHGVVDEDPDQGAARFLAWLAATRRRWLVVLDDVADPNDLRGLWPPAGSFGRTVVTTRRRDAALVAGRRVVDVGLFTSAECVAYLRAKLGSDPARLDQAAELAEDLGHLPLALAQAAAYILDRRSMTCAGYRRRLADQSRELADLTPEALPDEHSGPIAVAWSLSIARADEFAPVGVARPVLELAALLNPNGIPTDVFTTTAILGYLATRSRAGRPADGEDATDALDNLDRLNLITHDPANRTARVHGLLQRVVREATPTAQAAALAITTANALVEIWPDIERDPELGQTLRANTDALNTHAGLLLWDSDNGGHRVLFRAGRSLGETGQVSAAFDYHRALPRTRPPRHPDHAPQPRPLAGGGRGSGRRRHRLRGPAHRPAAGPAGAATAYADLLTDRLQVLGPDHPDTLTTRTNLAYWQGVAGDPAGAATACADLLTDMVRVVGPDHPGTLATRTNLAYWQGVAGDPAGAATACADLLTDMVRVLGPDHPGTLITRGNLTRWRGDGGRPGIRPVPPPPAPTCSPTRCGSSDPTTLTPSPPAATSPVGGGRPGIRPVPPPPAPTCSPTRCGSSDPTTPTPSPPAIVLFFGEGRQARLPESSTQQRHRP